MAQTESIYRALTLNSIELLALILLVILGLELVVKHARSLLEAVRQLYLDVKGWKEPPSKNLSG